MPVAEVRWTNDPGVVDTKVKETSNSELFGNDFVRGRKTNDRSVPSEKSPCPRLASLPIQSWASRSRKSVISTTNELTPSFSRSPAHRIDEANESRTARCSDGLTDPARYLKFSCYR